MVRVAAVTHAAALAGVASSGALLGGVRPLDAQQYVTDDAAITEYRACQIQTWLGQRASSVLPVCTPVRNVEVSLGVIAVRAGGDGHGNGYLKYVVQGKTPLKPLTANGWGAGFVLGMGRDPALAGTRPDVETVYAYVPVSVSTAGDRVVLHQNVGWSYQRVGDERGSRGRHAFSWATRAEVALDRPRRSVVAVAEAYGTTWRDRTAPEFQVGLRAFSRREQARVDVSWGGLLRSGTRAAGWTLGLTLVTPPFL